MCFCFSAGFPDGFPSEYSIIATFKMLEDTSQNMWHLWQVSDSDGKDKVGIQVLRDNKNLDFFYASSYKIILFRTFNNMDKIFDSSWHKLALSVKGSNVKLLIDCQEVSAVPTNEHGDIYRNLHTSLVKRSVEKSSVLVSISQHTGMYQSLLLHCPLLEIFNRRKPFGSVSGGGGRVFKASNLFFY